MSKKIIIIIGGLIILGVAYYVISPLFRNVLIDEAAPIEKQEMTTETGDGETQEAMMEGSSTEPTMMEKKMEAATPTTKTTSVIGSAGHPASGSVRLINTDGGTVIRYENFKTINGPDLYLYLAKDLKASDYVSLGKLKATEGNVNYTVPANINIDDYQYVMVWCEQFGVLFNHADLYTLR